MEISLVDDYDYEGKIIRCNAIQFNAMHGNAWQCKEIQNISIQLETHLFQYPFLSQVGFLLPRVAGFRSGLVTYLFKLGHNITIMHNKQRQQLCWNRTGCYSE